MKELTNQLMQPVVLEDGIVLAAAGTPGSTKQVESISESDDRRLVQSGIVTVRETDFAGAPAEAESRKRSAAAEKESIK